jgi:hypothetical protein
MTVCKSIYLYYYKEIQEPDTWDYKFSHLFGMIFNQITGFELKIYSNLDVSRANVLKINFLDISTMDAFVIIQNTIGQLSENSERLKEINEKLNGFPVEKVFQVIKKTDDFLLESNLIFNFQQYKFYELNLRNMQVLEYNPDIPGDSEKGFWEKLSDLVYDVKFINSDLAKSNSRDRTIFLAEVSDDQIKNREKIKRELLLLGYRVLPICPLPRKVEDFENTVISLLYESILSVNILGELYGETPQMTDYSYTEIQNRIFEKEYIAQKNLPIEPKIHRIIWNQPVMEISDEKQAQYLKRIEKEILSTHNTELVQSSITDLIEIIEKKIKKIKSEGFEFIEEEHKSCLCIIYDQLPDENRTVIQNKLDNEKLLYQFYDIKNTQIGSINELLLDFKFKHNFLIINTLKSYSWVCSILALIIRSKGIADAQPLLSIILLTIDTEKNYDYLSPIEVQKMPYQAYNFEVQLERILSKLKI